MQKIQRELSFAPQMTGLAMAMKKRTIRKQLLMAILPLVLPALAMLYVLPFLSKYGAYPSTSTPIPYRGNGNELMLDWWTPKKSAGSTRVAHLLGLGTQREPSANSEHHLEDAADAARSHFYSYSCQLPTFTTSSSSSHEPENSEEPCLQQLAAKLARAWLPAPRSRWCPGDRNITTGGIVLIKVPKSASSTVAGMALHAAFAVSSLPSSTNSSKLPRPSAGCPVEWEHSIASESPTLQTLAGRPSHKSSISNHKEDERRRYLLLAPIRSPFKRALSDVYYHKVSLGSGTKKAPKDGYIISQLDRVPDNYILRYVTPLKWEPLISSLSQAPIGPKAKSGRDNPPFRIRRSLFEHVQKALHQYDFWLVVDRLEESIVVLANLTETSFHDWVTMPSKVSGSYYRSSPNACVALVRPNATPRILQHAQNLWNPRNAGDRLLYEVATACLDRTIDRIGRDWVAKQVQRLRAFQHHIAVQCARETHFPCSPSGQVQHEASVASCYVRDFGCGHACVRRESQEWESRQRRTGAD
jgi:hypothetical protein